MEFTGTLLPHQIDAVNWMTDRENSSDVKGGFVCDDMGLGKTVQVLATICDPRTYDGETLVICPAALVIQWQNEISKFVGQWERVPITVMSYNKLLTNTSVIQRHWHRLVLDEAHELRNHRSKRYIEAAKIYSTITWCLTGTPVFNCEKDFKNMALLAGIQGEVGVEEIVSKFVLRRTKENILNIPNLSMNVVELEMHPHEKEVYVDVWDRACVMAKRATESQMKGYYQMLLLESLLRVRQAAIHPQLLTPTERWEGRSTKIEYIQNIMSNSRKEKTIIFTQFRIEQDILENIMKEMGWAVWRVSGQEDKFQKARALQNFTVHDDQKSVLLIQIKAGGVGLNIQVASRIIITAPSWNPATELQAIARAHRNGQTKPVTVYKLIYKDPTPSHISIDQCMTNLQYQKQTLTARILNDPVLESKIVPTKSKQSLKDLIDMFLGKPTPLNSQKQTNQG